MRILVIVQGSYGERIVKNLRTHNPNSWEIESVTLPMALPAIIDEPSEYLPGNLPECDLVIFLSESPQAPQLIPDIARATRAKGVIAPIDHSAWMPMGLKGQVQRELASMGVGSAFPKNFCTLTETTYGYRESAQPYDCEVISAFARHFGRPRLRAQIDLGTRTIEAVEIERCSPCGSTYHAARKIIGMSVDEAVPRAGLICMHYPCLASMHMEQIDRGLYNTLMHLSGQIFNEELEPQVSPFRAAPARGEPVE